LCIILGVLMSWAAFGGTDLPGLGSNHTARVLVIFDNSRSMRALPQNATDMYCAPNDDYFVTDAGVPLGIPEFPALNCGPGGATDMTRCRNKLCIGKSVMYNALDPFQGKIDIGVGSYFQYLRQTKTHFTRSANLQTICDYDVLAAPNETAVAAGSSSLSGGMADTFPNPPLFDFTGANNCYPTKWLRGCVDGNGGATPALRETPKSCVWTNNYVWSASYADHTIGQADTANIPWRKETCTNTECKNKNFQGGGSCTCSSNQGAFPTSNSVLSGPTPTNQMFTYTPVMGDLWNPGMMYQYWNADSYTYPSPWSGGCGGQDLSVPDCPANANANQWFTFETGPQSGNCMLGTTMNVNNGTWTAAGNGEPDTLCNAAESCDFTLQWDRTGPLQLTYRYANIGNGTVQNATPPWGANPGDGGMIPNCNQTAGPINGTTFADNEASATPTSCPGNISGYMGGATINGTHTLLGGNCASVPGGCDLSNGTQVHNDYTQYAYDNLAYTFLYNGVTPVAFQSTTTSTVDLYYDLGTGLMCPGPILPDGGMGNGDVPGTPFLFLNGQTHDSSGVTFKDCGPSGGPSDDGATRSWYCYGTLVAHEVQPDTGINTCHYQVTKRTMTASIYGCTWDRNEWDYQCGNGHFCGWQKHVQVWKPKYYETNWKTTGDEVIGRYKKTASNTAYGCNQTLAGGPPRTLPGGICPEQLTSGGPCGGGRKCLLKWAHDDTTDYSAPIYHGRLENFVGLPDGGGNFNAMETGDYDPNALNNYCLAPDHQVAPGPLGPIGTPNPTPLKAAQRDAMLDIDTESDPSVSADWC
jgi:hypothetical protein